MDTTKILNELRTELNRLNQAIAAIESLDGMGTSTTVRRGRPVAAPKEYGRRGLTAHGRKRLSELAKARWAAKRKLAAIPATPKTGAHKPMSAATRKRLSILAKKRWAARKKAAKA
jgi:hypothetical protein